MTMRRKILSCHSVAVLSIGAASCGAAYFFPATGRIAGMVAANTAPIVCGVLIGAVSVLSSVLMVIYPALSERKSSLGARYNSIINIIPIYTDEIRDDTVVSVLLTAGVLVLDASTKIDRLPIIDQYYIFVTFLYSSFMMFSGIIMFLAALDVVRSMFSLFTVVHRIFGYSKDSDRTIKNTPAP